MPFCPVCRVRYSVSIKQCTDCECDLVQDPPEDDVPDEEGDWVLLYSTSNRVHAEFLKETLDDSNINCVIRSAGSFFEHGLGYVAKDWMGYRVYVLEEDYEEGSAIKDQTVGNV